MRSCSLHLSLSFFPRIISAFWPLYRNNSLINTDFFGKYCVVIKKEADTLTLKKVPTISRTAMAASLNANIDTLSRHIEISCAEAERKEHHWARHFFTKRLMDRKIVKNRPLQQDEPLWTINRYHWRPPVSFSARAGGVYNHPKMYSRLWRYNNANINIRCRSNRLFICDLVQWSWLWNNPLCKR